MLQNYLKIALRNLLRNKVYSFINILGLAIGVSACLVIFLLVSFEVSFDNFHPDRERIYRITSGFKNPDGSAYYNAGLSAPMPAVIRQELTGIESLSAFFNWSAKVTIPNHKNDTKNPPKTWKSGDSEDLPIIICEPQYFQIFQYKWLQGNPKNALKTPNEVVLTEEKAVKYFGKIPLDKVMGKQLYYNDSLVVTVTGIVKSLPKNSDFKFGDFISFKSITGKNRREEFGLDQWINTNGDSQALVKLTKGTSEANINKQLVKFLGKHLDKKDEWSVGRSLSLQPLSNIHFSAEYGDSFSRQVHLPTLYALMGIAIVYNQVYPDNDQVFNPVFFDETFTNFYKKEQQFAQILNTATGIAIFISCMGLFGLVAFTTQRRTKEIGIRKVLGASVTQIVNLLSKDFLKLVILGIVIASPIAYWAMNKWLQDFAYRVEISWWIFALAGIVAIVIALLTVSYQSIRAAMANPVKSLRTE